jgi:hypothetical protein
MEVAGQIAARRRRHPKMYVSIDTIGEGAGVYSRCLEVESEPKYIISCKYSEAAKDYRGRELTDLTGENKFANMRAYLHWCVRNWLNPVNKTGAMLPPNERFIEEATEIRWKFRSDGRIIIEPKEDIKKRLGRSPDLFDALANTFYPIRIDKGIDLDRLKHLV